MAVLNIYAGSAAGSMAQLPSPVSLKPTKEIIWSENTGRAQSGTNKAKMIGDVVAEKTTYNIQWGILTQSELNLIESKLTPGFFYFGTGTSASAAESSAKKYYRGTINYEAIQVGSEIRYKDAAVSVIEQ